MKPEFPAVLTPEEVAEFTRTSKEAVVAELDARRIHGFRIGDEWRVTKDSLLAFMDGQSGSSGGNITNTQVISGVEWKRKEPFVYKWPEGTEEHFDPAYAADVELSSGKYNFTIGYTVRDAAGMKDRRRVIVFLSVGNQFVPVVEFSGANDFTETRRLASVIKEQTGHHVRSQSQLPLEYEGMPTVIYSDIVVGPYAAKSLAVVVDEDDRNVMLRHALIRARYKGWIPD